jgi:hypothetical protein
MACRIGTTLELSLPLQLRAGLGLLIGHGDLSVCLVAERLLRGWAAQWVGMFVTVGTVALSGKVECGAGHQMPTSTMSTEDRMTETTPAPAEVMETDTMLTAVKNAENVEQLKTSLTALVSYIKEKKISYKTHPEVMDEISYVMTVALRKHKSTLDQVLSDELREVVLEYKWKSLVSFTKQVVEDEETKTLKESIVNYCLYNPPMLLVIIVLAALGLVVTPFLLLADCYKILRRRIKKKLQ